MSNRDRKKSEIRKKLSSFKSFSKDSVYKKYWTEILRPNKNIQETSQHVTLFLLSE